MFVPYLLIVRWAALEWSCIVGNLDTRFGQGRRILLVLSKWLHSMNYWFFFQNEVSLMFASSWWQYCYLEGMTVQGKQEHASVGSVSEEIQCLFAEKCSLSHNAWFAINSQGSILMNTKLKITNTIMTFTVFKGWVEGNKSDILCRSVDREFKLISQSRQTRM